MKIRRIGMALAICFLMLGMPSEAHPYCQRDSEFQTGTGRASAFNRDWDPEPEGRGNKRFGQQQ